MAACSGLLLIGATSAQVQQNVTNLTMNQTSLFDCYAFCVCVQVKELEKLQKLAALPSEQEALADK